MCVYKVGECNECVCTKWENVMNVCVQSGRM